KSKCVRRDVAAGELLGALSCVVEHVLVAAADHLFEDVVLFLVLEKFGHLKAGTPAGPAACYVMDLDHGNALGVRVGKRIEEHVLDDAEDRSGRANPERQRQNGEA